MAEATMYEPTSLFLLGTGLLGVGLLVKCIRQRQSGLKRRPGSTQPKVQDLVAGDSASGKTKPTFYFE